MMNTRKPFRFLRTACLLAVLAGSAHAQLPAPSESALQAGPAATAAAPTSRPGSPSSVQVSNEQISYATGVVTVRNFAKNKIEIDVEAVIRGMRDAIAGNKSLAMNDKEIRTAMNALQVELRRMDKLNKREAADVNNQRGLAFQAEYKQQPGVKALGNGILYREIKAGTGPKPTELDHVVVNYRGSLTDGTEFDATHADQPVTLRLVQGIMGWREALKRMPQGSTWEIVIPHPLAYGERGVPGSIGPNETLVFQVELLDIKRS